MKKIVIAALILISGFIELFSQTSFSLPQATSHYMSLSKFRALPSRERAWMDTIQYPWTEYSRGALAQSLMRTVYLLPEDESKLPTLVAYPANSSDQTRAELDYLLDLQKSRTTQEIERAEFIAEVGSSPTILNPTDSLYHENLRQLFYIAESVGAAYNPENFPVTTRLLLNCIQDIRVTEFRLKLAFRRARPYHLEQRLQPLARISSPSFVSGHTLWAFTEAFLFSELIPERREGFLQRAEEVRWSRELLGIHYPSDNEASRIVSWNLLMYWFKNPKFVSDLNAAKEELKSKSYLLKR